MIPLCVLPLLASGPFTDLSADFELPDGLAVTLWAESPALYNPAAIDVDEEGRVWVAEAVNYRTWDGRNPGRRHPEGDRIVVLADTDGDGKADASHVFVQDPELTAPLGLAVIAGKVYVSCSPNLFVYTDVDGDGRADERETLLTGFGGHDHDHGLHSVVCGPDGKLYFTVGNAGPHVVTDKSGWTLRSGSVYRGGGRFEADNKPGLVSDDGRVWTGGLVCRVNVDGTGLEVLAHGFRNGYEVALDSWAEMYVTDNDDDGAAACRTTWVMPGGSYGFFSADGSRTWQADRRPGQDAWTAHWHQDDPGVLPAGTQNGAGGPTGCCVYEGALLERWIDGAVVNADAGARVVYAHFPEKKGAGVELRQTDLLRARGEAQGARWFRPSDVCVGTDGALYVSDWWDPGVGGHQAGDQEAYGRILRIAPAGSAPQVPEIDVSTSDGALEALASPATNVRELGRRAIVGAGEAWFPQLEQELNRRIATGLGWRLYKAMRAATGWYGRSHVRGYTAGELLRGSLLAQRGDPFEGDLVNILTLAPKVERSDRFAVEALGLAAEGFEEEVYERLLAELGSDDPLRWDARFAALAWRLHPPAAVPAFRARALAPELPVDARRQALDALAFTPTRDAAEALLAAAQAGPEDLRAYAAWWVKHRDGNDWRAYGLGDRVRAGGFDDAELLWRSDVVESGIVDVEVDVTGAETVWLVVGDAGNGNACDWADWIAPRLAGGGRTWDLTATPWLAAEAAWGTTQVGRDCAGGELSAGGVATADGIGTHAASRIAFAVPAGAERFSAHAGPDETGVSQGCGTSVVFEVWATRPPAASEAAAWERGMLDPAVPARERREHAVALASDPQGALRLIRLAERGVLPAELVDVVAEAIHRNPDLGVRALASAAFPRPGAPDTPSIPELVAMLERGGDAARGRAVFQDRERAQCITCHAFTSGDATVGGDVGPDLTAIGAKYDAAALCDAILNPSAAIAHGYDTWLVETLDGRLYSGFLLADGPTVVLKDTQGERHVLDAEEIADRVPQKLSTMPEGVALGLAPDELCDLVAFLREPGRATGLLGVERGGAPATDGVRPALGEPIPLFDGTALDAWTCHLPDGTPCDAVWSVADGVLACAGQPIGYLRTQDRFTSFHLAVEWRFDPAQGAGNSGVLLRVNGADQVWPRSIEAQLHSTNAGDIWNIDAMSMQVAPERTSGRRTERGQPSSEKPLGEWNRYDVWLWGPRLELYVNGVLQNTADWCEETPGYVALQSEGAPIEFRTVVLTPIAE